MSKWLKDKRLWLFGGVLLVIVSVVFVLINLQANATAAQAQSGDVVEAFIGNLAASATASGRVEPQRSATLTAETPGRVTAVSVRVGDVVTAGETLLQLDPAGAELNLAAAEQALRLQEANLAALQDPPAAAEVAAAEAAVRSAQANLDDLLNGPMAEEIAAREADLRAAQASVTSSTAQLNQARDAITEADIAAAEAALASAEAELKSVEIQYTRNPDPDNIQANTALAQAREQVAAAQARLDTLRAGPQSFQVGGAEANLAAAQAQRDATAVQLQQFTAAPREAEIAAARAQLAQAEATLTALQTVATPEEIAAAEAEVAQARLSLEDAESGLEATTIRAPFDGVITAVNVHPGEFASGAVVEIMDQNSLLVVLEIDEVDISQISEGQRGVIALETWPDVDIDGTVTRISPAPAAPGSALTTFEVQMALDETDLPVRAGMTANANLITAEKEDVLLVPNQAIRINRMEGTYSVNRLLPDGSVETVQVEIGLRDNAYTEIRSGLNTGDQIVVGSSAPVFSFEEGGPPPGAQQQDGPFN